MKTPMTKLMLAATAATLLCLGANADGTHDAVQLWEGGPYWAECNVGATKPEEYGYYFWWGDTVGYKRENDAWVASDGSTSNFSFNSGNTPTYYKSNDALLSSGYIDSTGNLVAAHDAATAHLGSPWRMPTDAEFSALISNCTTTWITTNGVAGRLVTGKGDYADRSIFLPAAGNGNASYLTSAGSVGLYGSSTPFSGYSDSACNLFSNSDAFLKTNGYRSYGLSVRPVKSIATIDITWLNDDGTEIDMTIVSSNAVPSHAEPTKEASAPYRWVFTGWTPELEAAVSNTTYMATFQKIADLALVTEDWTAKDGDMITGETTHKVTIPGGATVTINGVAVAGGGGGAAVDAPSFSDSGESAVTKFAQGNDGKWTVTAFAEMEGDSIGSAVTDGQIKVYAADSVEGLKTAEPLASGVEVEERKSAVKTKINVTLPSTPEKQFFKVTFGD